MNYDADKTDLAIDDLKAAIRDGRMKAAVQLLRHADAGGKIRADKGLLALLQDALGERRAAELVAVFAEEPCPFCSSGREPCPECEGRGYFPDSVCRACAALGLRRCPYCNGTALAGYDFVPRGLRPAVIRARLESAINELGDLAAARPAARPSARELAKKIIAFDRCRGVLANAVEQSAALARDSAAAGAILSAADRTRIERECRRHNAGAETAIRALLLQMADRFAGKAAAADPDAQRLQRNRAELFASLGKGEGLAGSALRTPAALKQN